MTPDVTLTQTHGPAVGPDTLVVVSDALLPLVALRDVPVVREIRKELTELERFLLEAALALGKLDAAELKEVVSLPRSVLAGGMSRLLAGGALVAAGGEFHVVAEVASRFLQQEVVIREAETTADFVLLPRTGDLLAVPAHKGGWLRELERLLPAAAAPVPRALSDQRMHTFLAARLREGTVAGSEADVTRVRRVESEPPLLAPARALNRSQIGGVCPAYGCQAEVRREPGGGYVVDAVLRGRTRRPGRGSNAPDREDELAQVQVDLSGVVGLVERWLELASALKDPATLRAAWRELDLPQEHADGCPPARRTSPVGWEFALDGAAARAIAGQGRSLSQPIGLAIAGEEAVVELLCGFAPGDEDARALFARDGVVATLLASNAPADELGAACHAAGARLRRAKSELSPAAVRERIWQLRAFRLAYTLREREDFPYD